MLEVEVVPAGAPPPGFAIEWYVDAPGVGEASTSSLRALPGTPGAIEYRPPAGARGPVVVRAELRTEDCAGDARASRACSAEFALNVVAPEPPTLRVFVGGNEPGEFLLQWTAAGTEAIRWQYRYNPRFERTETGLRRLASWGDWMDVPHSDSDTRNHRVTGFVGDFHIFQVRGWTATGAGIAYNPVEALASERVMKGIVQVPVGRLLESGRRIAWGSCSFVVPHGMHVDIPNTTDIGPQYVGSDAGIRLRDTKSGSSMLVNATTCELVLRSIFHSGPDLTVSNPRPRNVDALFKQIVESFEKISLP